MFLMTGRTGTVLHDVRLVQSVMRVTSLALLIDCLESDAIMKPIAQNLLECRRCERAAGHQRLVVALRAVLREFRMRRGNLAGVKKCFVLSAFLENPNRE